VETYKTRLVRSVVPARGSEKETALEVSRVQANHRKTLLRMLREGNLTPIAGTFRTYAVTRPNGSVDVRSHQDGAVRG